MKNKHWYLLLALLLLRFGSTVAQTSPISEKIIDEYAISGAKALNELIAYNALNKQNGQPQLNKYVLNLEDYLSPQQKALLGDEAQRYAFDFTTNAVTSPLSTANLTKLNDELIQLNTTLASNGKPEIYVAVDAWLGRVMQISEITQLRDKINLDEEISNQKGYDNKQGIYSKYDGLFAKITTLLNSSKGTEKLICLGQFGITTPHPNAENTFRKGHMLSIRQVGNATTDPIQNDLVAAGISNRPLTFDQQGYLTLLETWANGLAKALNGTLENKLIGAGKLLYEDCTKGVFVNKGGKDLDRKLLLSVSKQLEEMMEESTYNEFLKSSLLTLTNGKQLTNEDLQALQQSLNQFKEDQKVIWDGNFSPQYLSQLLNFFKTICETEACPAANEGILPQCLWNNKITPVAAPPFTEGDIPTSAGVIDGLYLSIKGLVDLGISVKDAIQYLNCFNPHEVDTWLSKECVTNRKNAVANLLLMSEIIKDREKLKSVVSTVGSTLGNSFLKWGDETFCISSNALLPSRCCRYNQGKLIFDIASLFIGIGEVKAAMNGGNIVSFLSGKLDKLAKYYERYKKVSTIIEVSAKREAATSKIVQEIAAKFPDVQNRLVKFADVVPAKGKTASSTADKLEAVLEIATQGKADNATNAVVKQMKIGANELSGELSEATETLIKHGEELLSPAQLRELGLAYKPHPSGSGNMLVIGEKTIEEIGGNPSTYYKPIAIVLATGAVYSITHDTPCPICSNRNPSQALCQKLDQLAQTNRPAVENKLCPNIASNQILESVADKVLGFSATEKQVFLQDVNLSLTQIQALNQSANIAQLNPLLMDAWQIIYAGRSGANDRQRTDFETIKNVKAMRDVALLPAAEISTLIEKNKRAGCNTCTVTSNTKDYLNKMDEYMLDIKHFVDNFKSVNGYTKAMNYLRSDAHWNRVEPEAFIIRVLRSENINSATELEAVATGCEPDVILSDGTYCEFKSWTSGTIGEDDADEDDPSPQTGFVTCFDRFKTGTSPSFNQFKSYLTLPQISNLTKLRYYFDERKIQTTGDKAAWVKGQFQKMMYDGTNLTTNGTAIFDAIFGNIALRGALFDLSATATKTPQEQFKEIVSNINNGFYQFIKVK
jgi:hypothetical protein